jgi:hypothetical protein
MRLLEPMQFLPKDFGYNLLGLALAAASAAFPIYIYNNPDKFGPPRMQYAALDLEGGEAETRRARFQEATGAVAASTDPDPIEVGTTAAAIAPGGSRNLPEKSAPSGPPILDGVMTGTVSLPRPHKQEARQAPPEQPFPDDLEPVNLLFVSAGGALVMAEGGIEIVEEGSELPDGSKVLSIREKDGSWEILTTGERVLTWRKS